MRVWNWRGWLFASPAVVAWIAMDPAVVARCMSRDGALSENSSRSLLALRSAAVPPLAVALLVAGLAACPPRWLGAARTAALRRLVARVLLAASVTLAMLALAEGVTRWRLARASFARVAHYRASADPHLVYELVPGSVTERDGVEYRVNSAGFRGPEWPASGRCRLLVVGDSMVYGDGVSEDGLFWRRLEKALRERHGADAWVAGAGVGGYGTYQERRLVEVHAPRLQPDRIVLLFCMNDAEDPYAHVKVGGLPYPDEAVPIAAGRAAFASTAPRRTAPLSWGALDLVHHVLLRASRFYGEARLALVAARRRLDGAPAPAPRDTPGIASLVALSDPDSPQARWLAGQLERLARTARALGRPLGVAIAPLSRQFGPGAEHPRAPQETVRALCAKLALPCLDLTPALAAEHDGPLFQDLCHFTDLGHAVAARAMLAWMDGW